jgi:hypothetical protein
MLDSQKLRSMIRAVLLEDRASFIAAAADADLEYYGDDRDPLFMWKQNIPLRKKARRLKDLWRQHSDQRSFEDITFVHWLPNPVQNLSSMWSAPRNDEISVSMTPNSGPIIDTGWGPVGMEVRGRVTFAGNNMDQMMTGYMSKAKAKDHAKYPQGGRPKRPVESRPAWWKSYALQASELTYDPGEVNEALIDNWEPVSWVVSDNIANVFAPSRMSDKIEQEEMLDVIRASGLPIMDLNRQPISLDELEALL